MANDNAINIEHVLEVAAILFAEIGFDGVSMRQIAKSSGTPASSIYYHFPTKAVLFEEAFSHKLDETSEQLESKLQAMEEAEDRVDKLVEIIYQMFREDQVLSLLMNRDITLTKLSNKPMLSQRQYSYFSGIMRHCVSEWTGKDIGETGAFSLGALIYGYAELGPPARLSNPRLKGIDDQFLLRELQSKIKMLIQ